MVLFDLDRMRGSDKYNSFLDPDEVKRVISKYGYHISLGDQDWFTNIGFEVHINHFYQQLLKYLIIILVS